MAMAEKFHPPIIDSEMIGLHERLGGGIDRATLLVTDADNHQFSLTVATTSEYERSLADEWNVQNTNEESEPVFLIPAQQLDADVIDTVVNLPPKLLSKYLVEQYVTLEPLEPNE
jgi:hypothetical protein